MKKNSENGRSMLEMMGVLAIIGVLSVGGLNMITKMSNSRKVNAVMDEIGGLITKARGLAHEYDPSDDDDFAEYLYDSKAYPQELEWCKPSDSVDNCSKYDFLGTDDVNYTIKYVHSSSKNLFTVEIKDLTEDMCMAVAVNNWGSVSTNGFVKIEIQGKLNKEFTGSDLPVTIGDAGTYCTTKNDGTGPEIILTFR